MRSSRIKTAPFYYLFLGLLLITVAHSIGCQKASQEKNESKNQEAPAPLKMNIKEDTQQIEEKAWLESGVGEKDLRSILTESCYKDKIEFISCVNGLDTSIKMVSTNMRFGPSDYWEKSPYEIKRIVKSFGSFQIVEISLKNTNPDPSFKVFFERRMNQQKLFYETISSQIEKRDLDFKEATTTLLELAKTMWKNNSETLAFRYFINGYLPVRDFISHLEPLSYFKWTISQSEPTSSIKLLDEVTFVDNSFLIKHIDGESPANAAGLRQGDRILGFNGKKLSERNLESIAKSFEKYDEPFIEIEVLKADGKIVNFQIPNIIDNKPLPLLSYDKIIHKEKNYRLIKIHDFSNTNIYNMLKAKLTQESNTGVFGYIVDLRGNQGGLLEQAVLIAKLFLDGDKNLGYLREINSQRKEPIKQIIDFKDPMPNPINAPLVILTNKESASASELFTGLMREYSRAVIVGQRTFGKGSAQLPYYWDYPNNKVIVWKTSKIIYLPSELTYNLVGIIPDFTVPWRTGASIDEDFYPTNEFFSVSNLTQSENEAIEPKDVERNKQIEKCLDKNWILNEEKRLFGTHEQSDLQFLYGIEVLRCMN